MIGNGVRGSESCGRRGEAGCGIREKVDGIRDASHNDLLLAGAVRGEGFEDWIKELLHRGHGSRCSYLAHIDKVRGTQL